MTKLKIKVTKDVLRESMWCGIDGVSTPMTNCAIAIAVRGIWPLAAVRTTDILTEARIDSFGLGYLTYSGYKIQLPDEAREFIHRFDDTYPEARPLLPELEFEIDVPDEVINQINIDDIIRSTTLELVKPQS